MKFLHITVNPNQMGGVACIRGLRVPVATVVSMLADGMTEDEILREFPDLEREDIHEVLHYAAEAVRERELPVMPERVSTSASMLEVATPASSSAPPSRHRHGL
jgi:uncharacterized protein (DUF433 family)